MLTFSLYLTEQYAKKCIKKKFVVFLYISVKLGAHEGTIPQLNAVKEQIKRTYCTTSHQIIK
jgi:hypothetical protein